MKELIYEKIYGHHQNIHGTKWFFRTMLTTTLINK